jgi:hypothetical protein
VAVQVTTTATKAPTTKEERKAVEASAKLANIQLQSAKLAQEQQAEQKKEMEAKKQTESEKTYRNAYLIVLFDLLAVVFKFAASYIWASRGDEKGSAAPAPNSPAPPAPNPPAPKILTNPSTPHPAPQPDPPSPKPAGKITPLFLAPAAQAESETSEDLANVSDEDIKKRFTSNRARMLRNEAGSEEKYNLYLSELEARNLEIPQQRPRKTG